MLEVEIKANLTEFAKENIRDKAEKLGFVYSSTLKETDLYFNGNDRDFRHTDEAPRLRNYQRTSSDDKEYSRSETLITYKGPKIDNTSSSRIEHETGITDFNTAKRLLSALGYIPLFTVEKTRDEFTAVCTKRDQCITLCLDTVTGLGNYMELEILVNSESERESASDCLFNILDKLGIPQENVTRKSYLELLFMKVKNK